jgi:drug/metabolite transporter (DMT)-like permease
LGSLLALVALGLFSANVFVVRAASARLAQQLGFLVALLANVVFGATLLGVDLVARDDGITMNGGAFATFAAAGVLASYLGRRGFFRSVETLGPSRASSVQITNPVFAALLAWALLGEALRLVDALLVGCVVTGLYLATLPPPDAADARPNRRRGPAAVPLAALWPALFSAVAYAGGNVLRAGALDAWREPVLGGLVGAVAGTAVFALVHVRAGDLRAMATAPVTGIWLWALAGTLTISAQISVIGATGYLPVAIVLVISSALPVVVVPVSLFVLRNVEALRSSTLAGTGLVLVGVVGVLLR